MTSYFFLFAGLLGLIYYIFGRTNTSRLTIILVASLCFYNYFGGWLATSVISILGLFTYLVAFVIKKYSIYKKDSKLLLLLSLSPIILSLTYFKYVDFLKNILAYILDTLGLEKLEKLSVGVGSSNNIIAILGISFFTFEFTHYLVEIYRGADALKNPLHFSLFVFYFPRLASGPIVRINQIVPQFQNLERPSTSDFAIGLIRVVIGFGKKFLLADQAAAVISSTYQISNILSPIDVIMLIILLYVRIYFDFSAYSDMAIGISRMFGIKLPENFAWPFLATSLIEFWKRWHISLSTWIRDYIYIPLGGSRISKKRKFTNLAIAMSLCGLWHGPAWNFCLWGFLHGIALIMNHFISEQKFIHIVQITSSSKKSYFLSKTNTFSGLVATQMFVGFAWIPFFYPLNDTLYIISKLGFWL